MVFYGSMKVLVGQPSNQFSILVEEILSYQLAHQEERVATLSKYYQNSGLAVAQ